MIKWTSKKTLTLFIVLINLLLISLESHAQAFSSRKPLNFEDYPVPEEEMYLKKPAFLDLNSHPDAFKFRVHLNSEYTKGTNFAGHYSLIVEDCNEDCRNVWIIDTKTGKIVLKKELRIKDATHAQFAFRKDSTLFIINPIDTTQMLPPTAFLGGASVNTPQSNLVQTRYLSFDGTDLKELTVVHWVKSS